jgi:hypothetical protein
MKKKIFHFFSLFSLSFSLCTRVERDMASPPDDPDDDPHLLLEVALDGAHPPSCAAAWCGATGALAVALLDDDRRSSSAPSSMMVMMGGGNSFPSSSGRALSRPASTEVAVLDLERPQVKRRRLLKVPFGTRCVFDSNAFFFPIIKTSEEKKTHPFFLSFSPSTRQNRTTRSFASRAAPSPSRTSPGALPGPGWRSRRGQTPERSSFGPLFLLLLFPPLLLLLSTTPPRPPARAGSAPRSPWTAAPLLLASRPCAGSSPPTAGGGGEKEKKEEKEQTRR